MYEEDQGTVLARKVMEWWEDGSGARVTEAFNGGEPEFVTLARAMLVEVTGEA